MDHALVAIDDVQLADVAKSCTDLFYGLLDVTSKHVENGSYVESALRIDEQAARFRIWAGNLGVFAHAHGSLDYRLRDSPGAKRVALDQLEGLQSNLERGMYICCSGQEMQLIT